MNAVAEIDVPRISADQRELRSFRHEATFDVANLEIFQRQHVFLLLLLQAKTTISVENRCGLLEHVLHPNR